MEKDVNTKAPSARFKRAMACNELIKEIATTGTKILKVPGDGSGLFRPNARSNIIYIDHYTKVELPIHNTRTKKWDLNLCHGGGLHWFIEQLCRYIRTGKRISPVLFHLEQNHWGYSADELATLHRKGVELGVCEP